MPVYTVSTLHHLAESPIVVKPEFKWNDWASVFHPRRRSSTAASRPEVSKKIEFDENDLADPDRAMAAFFLRQGFPKEEKKKELTEVIVPEVNESAVALDEENDDGWATVQKPKKRGMSRSSFSKWK